MKRALGLPHLSARRHFLGHDAGKENPSRARWFLWVEEGFREAEVARISEQSIRKELHREGALQNFLGLPWAHGCVLCTCVGWRSTVLGTEWSGSWHWAFSSRSCLFIHLCYPGAIWDFDRSFRGKVIFSLKCSIGTSRLDIWKWWKKTHFWKLNDRTWDTDLRLIS